MTIPLPGMALLRSTKCPGLMADSGRRPIGACRVCHRTGCSIRLERFWLRAAILVRFVADSTKLKSRPYAGCEAEIVKSLRGEAEGGYPWLAILDADGKVLAISNKPDDG